MSTQICRLCMSSTSLQDLYVMDGNMTLDKKTMLCINIEIHPNDGLPTVICELCEKMVKSFFEFRENCMQVDNRLRNSINVYATDTRIVYTNEYNIIDQKYKHQNILENVYVQSTSSNEDSPKEDINPKKHNIKISDSGQLQKMGYQCELCGYVFKIKTALEKHLMTHNGIKPFSCKLCPKRFTRAENKMIHMRSHLGVRPFICEICGSSSTKRQDLIRHMSIHSDEKKFSCPRCNRQFKRSSDVSSHMRTHTGVRPYICTHCNRSYASHSGLRKHLKTHCKKDYNTS